MPNKHSTFQVLNESTGELMQMTAIAKQRPKKSPFTSFAMVSLETMGFIGQALSDKTLKPTDAIILTVMLEHMLEGNEVDIYIPEIAAKTGIDCANVRKSIKRLLFVNAIIKDKMIGKTQTYKISAWLAWRGNAEGHVTEIKRQNEIRRKERANLVSV